MIDHRTLAVHDQRFSRRARVKLNVRPGAQLTRRDRLGPLRDRSADLFPHQLNDLLKRQAKHRRRSVLSILKKFKAENVLSIRDEKRHCPLGALPRK